MKSKTINSNDILDKELKENRALNKKIKISQSNSRDEEPTDFLNSKEALKAKNSPYMKASFTDLNDLDEWLKNL